MEYFKNTRQIGVSLILVAPILLVYEVGLLVVGTDALNGADFITQQLLRLGGAGFVVFNLCILAAYVGGIYAFQSKGTHPTRMFVPLLLESGLYALVMGMLILTLMQEIHLLGPIEAQRGIPTNIVLSAGAGIHEELTFRLVLMGGLTWVFRRLLRTESLWGPGAIALLISSVLFSLAHFTAEAFAWFPFWYRTFAGMFFGGLFYARGFAVAVYTHALYDVYVLVLRG